jgi:hypothetical protein
MLQLLVTANVVTSWLILSTLMMETISSPKTSIHTTATRRHIPVDGIFRSLCVFHLGSPDRLSLPLPPPKELLLLTIPRYVFSPLRLTIYLLGYRRICLDGFLMPSRFTMTSILPSQSPPAIWSHRRKEWLDWHQNTIHIAKVTSLSTEGPH